MARYDGRGWHFQSERHSRAKKTGHAGGRYAMPRFAGMTNINKIPREDKINFLMKSGLHTRSQLEAMDDAQLNELTDAGLIATLPTSDMTYNQLKKKGVKLDPNKDSDGDGVKNKRDCRPLNKRAQDDGYNRFPVKNGIEIVTYADDTRNGFEHVAILKVNGKEVDRATAHYANRTWESYSFQTVMDNLLSKNKNLLTDDERKEFIRTGKRLDKETTLKMTGDRKVDDYLKKVIETRPSVQDEYVLRPIHDGRKSFYGKAKVLSNGEKKTLRSYSTNVAEIDLNTGKAKVFGTYSNTTLRHIKEFLKQNGFKAETSKQIMKDYGVDN